MSPIYAQWVVPLILFVLVTIYILYKFNKKFNDWLRIYWYKRVTFSRQISFSCFLFSLVFLLFAALDWRGPERPVDVKEQKAKVVILIDTSLSMRAEDVRPNRLDKALLIARHLVKSAVNMEFSLMVYSDFTKRISPFTFDTDLLDARIESLGDLRLSASGSSNTSQAIQEAAQYIQSEGESNLGSIIILSDAEVMDQDFPLKIPEKMSVAFVVVSTVQGSVIPLRSESGTLLGNKQYEGQNVITRMDQKVLDLYSKEISNFKYWIASSFSLPTAEILQFISSTSKTGNSSQRLRARDVFQEYFLVPAFILLIISILLKFLPQWKTITTLSICGLIFLFGGLFSKQSYGQIPSPNAPGKNDKKVIKIPEEELAKMNFLQEKWKKKGLEPSEKSALGSLYLKNKIYNKADSVYENQLSENEIQNSNKKDWFNWGVTKAQNGNPREALNIFKKLLENDAIKNDPELTKKIKESVLSMMQSQAQQSNQQQNNQDQENKEEKQKDQQDQENQEQQRSQQQQGQQGEEQKQNQQGDRQNSPISKDKPDDFQKQSDDESKEKFDKHLKDEKESNENAKGESEKDKSRDKESGNEEADNKETDKNEGEEKNQKDNKENQSEKGDDGKSADGKAPEENNKDGEPRQSSDQLRKNLPPIMKQLINEDRKLQQRLFDASTRERGRQIRKDW